jgi:RND family efflux transporter MFP subunit
MENKERRPKSKKKQNIISILIIFFGTIGAFLLFGPKDEEEQEEVRTPPALVEVMSLSDGGRIAQLEKTVTFSAGDEATEAVAEFSGRIREVRFNVGDYVEAGEVLAVFDQSRLENAPKVSLESAQRSFQIANKNLADTKDVVDRGIDLAERAVKIAKLQKEAVENSPLSTDEEKDIAKQNVKIAKDQEEQAYEAGELQINAASLQVEQSRAGLEQAKIAYAKTYVSAPIAGKIVSKKINEQAFINAGSEIASIVGSGCIEAVLYLSQEEIGRIRLGDSVEIKIDGQKYSAKIDSFSEIANKDNERFEVKIISSGDLVDKANRTGSVVLNFYLGSSQKDGLFIPLDAVIIGQNKKEVFVVQNGRAFSKEVEPGKTFGAQIEVLSGLSRDEIIVIKNSRNLQDGQEVRME